MRTKCLIEQDNKLFTIKDGILNYLGEKPSDDQEVLNLIIHKGYDSNIIIDKKIIDQIPGNSFNINARKLHDK